jgi:cell fate regulator YaaT (PSP1 superfamily)
MNITRAEFQFDGKKLTFYYTADAYVDFRDLVRALFKVFGTRIWMVWYKWEDAETEE